MVTPSVLTLKRCLRIGQTRLSIISCTVGTPSFWWEHSILDFPASILEIDLLIVSGITETTQTVFTLARLSLIRLRKNIRLPLQLLQVPGHHPSPPPPPSRAEQDWQSCQYFSSMCSFKYKHKSKIGESQKLCKRYHRPQGTLDTISQSYQKRGTSSNLSQYKDHRIRSWSTPPAQNQ